MKIFEYISFFIVYKITIFAFEVNFKRNGRRFEPHQGCLGGEKENQQMVGRKNGERPCNGFQVVHQQGAAERSHIGGDCQVP